MLLAGQEEEIRLILEIIMVEVVSVVGTVFCVWMCHLLRNVNDGEALGR